ncbi:MAG TPA: VOC family protein [Candidatus Binataceae bacterium]|nr:VOC family protein [Candidatus Binataceae bacterium]
MAVNPMPEGFRTLTPFLSVRDGAGAVEFYADVFGATLVERHDESGGKVTHALLRIGDSQVMISDETSEHAREHAHEGWSRSPQSLGGSSVTIYTYVPDVDSVFDRAVAAGAKVIERPEDKDWGDRVAGVRDPFGHIWSIATHKRDVPPDRH